MLAANHSLPKSPEVVQHTMWQMSMWNNSSRGVLTLQKKNTKKGRVCIENSWDQGPASHFSWATDEATNGMIQTLQRSGILDCDQNCSKVRDSLETDVDVDASIASMTNVVLRIPGIVEELVSLWINGITFPMRKIRYTKGKRCRFRNFQQALDRKRAQVDNLKFTSFN